MLEPVVPLDALVRDTMRGVTSANAKEFVEFYTALAESPDTPESAKRAASYCLGKLENLDRCVQRLKTLQPSTLQELIADAVLRLPYWPTGEVVLNAVLQAALIDGCLEYE